MSGGTAGRDTQHTRGHDFIFREKAVSRKRRKENQDNSDLASHDSRPCSTTFSMVGICWTTKVSFWFEQYVIKL